MMSYSLMHACIPYRSHAHAQDLILASSAGSSLAVTITIIVDTSAQVLARCGDGRNSSLSTTDLCYKCVCGEDREAMSSVDCV